MTEASNHIAALSELENASFGILDIALSSCGNENYEMEITNLWHLPWVLILFAWKLSIQSSFFIFFQMPSYFHGSWLFFWVAWSPRINLVSVVLWALVLNPMGTFSISHPASGPSELFIPRVGSQMEFVRIDFTFLKLSHSINIKQTTVLGDTKCDLVGKFEESGLLSNTDR